MPTATTRNRFRKPDSGGDNNTWGTNLNGGMFDLIDESLDGWTTVSTSTTLTSTQYVSNQARKRMLKYTGSGTGTITIPNLEKMYIVWASSTGDCVVTCGGTSATVKAGDVAVVICDGTDCKKVQSNDFAGSTLKNLGAPSSNADAATKQYVDGTAFAAGGLPGITGGTNRFFITNNGSTASWSPDGFDVRVTLNANTTLDYTYRYKTVVCTGNMTTLTLPVISSGSTPYDRFIFRVYNSNNTGPLRLVGQGSDTINGYSSIQLLTNDYIEITSRQDSSGTNRWFVTWFTGTEGSTSSPSTVRPAFGLELFAKQQQNSGVSPSSNTTTAGGFTTVAFNSTEGQQKAITLSSNIFTVLPGRYKFTISCPATSTGKSRLVLYNRSTSSVVFSGPMVNVGSSTTRVEAEGVYELLGSTAVTQTLDVRLYTELAGGNLGAPLSTGIPEVYSMMTVERMHYGVQV